MGYVALQDLVRRGEGGGGTEHKDETPVPVAVLARLSGSDLHPQFNTCRDPLHG